MDNKLKFVVLASVFTLAATGCSNYRGLGTNQNAAGGATGTTDYAAGASQPSRGGLFSQRRATAAPTTCTPCAAAAAKQANNSYTYTPAPAPKPKPAAGQHNQQYYIDRWKREQNQTTTYGTSGYNANAGANTTNYYDYSTAGKATGSVTASNKSIYTGSYQQKTYKPTTYAGGSAATTATSSGSANTYTVKKGDTVFEIMRQTGVYWKDIIKFNNLRAPAYNITPGQIIKLK